MTYSEALTMPKGTRVRFGNHPNIWTFFHYSKKRDDFAFTCPKGDFLKPIIVSPERLKNVHKLEVL
jgi:hypothetical protein